MTSEPTRKKPLLLRGGSVGLMLLGAACAAWALLNIAVPAARSVDTPAELSSLSATRAVDRFDLADFEPTATVTTATPKRRYPATGIAIGVLRIPVLGQEFPIIEGTGTEELKRGVGHFARSVLPGEDDNCVLSGHRDTVFRRLGALKVGDKLVVRTATGEFTYVIKRIRIVHKDDRTVIVPTDHAVLTVTTCYPFRYVGAAPDRYILSADLLAGEQVSQTGQ